MVGVRPRGGEDHDGQRGGDDEIGCGKTPALGADGGDGAPRRHAQEEQEDRILQCHEQEPQRSAERVPRAGSAVRHGEERGERAAGARPDDESECARAEQGERAGECDRPAALSGPEEPTAHGHRSADGGEFGQERAEKRGGGRPKGEPGRPARIAQAEADPPHVERGCQEVAFHLQAEQLERHGCVGEHAQRERQGPLDAKLVQREAQGDVEEHQRGDRQDQPRRDGIERQADEGAVQHKEQGHVARPAEPERVGGRPVEDAAGEVLREGRPHAARAVLGKRAGPIPRHERDRADERDETPDPDQPTLGLRERLHAPM